MDVPENIVNLEKGTENVRLDKNAVVKKQKYEEAAKLRDDEKRIEKELLIAQEKLQEDLKKVIRETVNEDDISEVVSMITGIPVNKIAKAELNQLSNLENKIEGRVIGQEEAVKKVVKAIQRNRAGIKDPNKPIGSFIF